jgi:hypothetical protein
MKGKWKHTHNLWWGSGPHEVMVIGNKGYLREDWEAGRHSFDAVDDVADDGVEVRWWNWTNGDPVTGAILARDVKRHEYGEQEQP